MAHLTPAYFEFFHNLAANNNSDWFKAHRKTYEDHVKKPFLQLVSDVLAQLQTVDARLQGQDPKKLIFRINRDIRFSQDKSPYKLNSSAVFSPLGKDNSVAGLYFHVGVAGYGGEHGATFVGGGAYMPSGEQLKRIREEIVHNTAAWEAAIQHPAFQKLYNGQVQGETLKRAPKGFEEETEHLPILRHKQFYYGLDIPESLILSHELVPALVAYYQASRPLMDFLIRAMQDT